MVAGARKRHLAQWVGPLRRPSHLRAKPRPPGCRVAALDGPNQARRRAAVVEGISGSAMFFVELLAYPPNLDPQSFASSPLYTVHLDPQGENGPAGSIRVDRCSRTRPGQTTGGRIIN